MRSCILNRFCLPRKVDRQDNCYRSKRHMCFLPIVVLIIFTGLLYVLPIMALKGLTVNYHVLLYLHLRQKPRNCDLTSSWSSRKDLPDSEPMWLSVPSATLAVRMMDSSSVWAANCSTYRVPKHLHLGELTSCRKWHEGHIVLMLIPCFNTCVI